MSRAMKRPNEETADPRCLLSLSMDRLLGRGFIGFLDFVAGRRQSSAARIFHEKQTIASHHPCEVVYTPMGIMKSEKMPHAVEEKQKLLNRVRRLRGQIEALERALEADAGCTDVMRLLTASRGAINGIMTEVVEDHILMHMIDADRKPSRAELDASEELLDVLRTYIK